MRLVVTAVSILAAAMAAPLAAQPARVPLVERHANATPGLILQGVTVHSGATMIYLSGQTASPLPSAAGKPQGQLTIDDLGDTKTQTISVLSKIKAALEQHGFKMTDVIKLTVFVGGDPKLGGKMDFAGMNEGFRQFFGSADNPNTVARSTVQVAALAGPANLVEIEATAAK